MTGFEWAMLILSALTTADTLTSKTKVETETPAPTSGIDPSDLTQLFGANTPDPLAAVSGLPTLEGPTKVATEAATTIPKTQVTTGPQIPAPGAAVAKAGTPVTTGPENPQLPQQKPEDIGQVLAAIPEALKAIAPLLGLTDQSINRQTAAPISGGAAGGLVGRFANPPGGGGIDIGQLLAALPGIRG